MLSTGDGFNHRAGSIFLCIPVLLYANVCVLTPFSPAVDPIRALYVLYYRNYLSRVPDTSLVDFTRAVAISIVNLFHHQSPCSSKATEPMVSQR